MGLAEEAIRKVEDLLERWNDTEAKALAKWFEGKFILKPARVPGDQKMNLWQLNATVTSLAWGHKDGLLQNWPRTKEALPALAAKFSVEGRGEDFVREVTVNGVLYKNLQNVPKTSFMKMVNIVDGVWKTIRGWQRKALAGSPVVAFAGPDQFRGTAKAKYRASEDTMLIRATPAVVKRTGGEYASFEYILVHELGHRYEHLRHPTIDFGRPEWWTTPYSRTEGGFGHSEAFAELFALSHFGIKNWGSQEFGPVVDRFEALMTGQSEPEEKVRPSGFVQRFEDLGIPRTASSTRVAHRFLVGATLNLREEAARSLQNRPDAAKASTLAGVLVEILGLIAGPKVDARAVESMARRMAPDLVKQAIRLRR